MGALGLNQRATVGVREVTQIENGTVMYFLKASLGFWVLAMVLAGSQLEATPASVENDPDCKQLNWGPYDPKPGHPTAAERQAFVDQIKPIAQEAEQRFKVPAAAIAAMAIQESGYGYTRTALNANNLFGYKWTPHGSGDRGRYMLTCQPASDPGKEYIVFKDYRDAVLFVSERLAKSSHYQNATMAYASIPSDRRIKGDVISWVSAIAKAGYNCCPQKYEKQITRAMNSPMSPSDHESADNLYLLSIKASNP